MLREGGRIKVKGVLELFQRALVFSAKVRVRVMSRKTSNWDLERRRGGGGEKAGKKEKKDREREIGRRKKKKKTEGEGGGEERGSPPAS